MHNPFNLWEPVLVDWASKLTEALTGENPAAFILIAESSGRVRQVVFASPQRTPEQLAFLQQHAPCWLYFEPGAEMRWHGLDAAIVERWMGAPLPAGSVGPAGVPGIGTYPLRG